MAGTFTFHNKFHRANHHTLSATGIPDAGLDPIASSRFPFQGIFYNTITDIEKTFIYEANSLQWWFAYTTMQGNSANWMLTRSLYSTVSSLSGNWNLGYVGYTTLRDNSGRYDSTYTTVCAFSAEWGSPYLMFTNKAQQYTQSKTFSGQTLTPLIDLPGLSTFDWNLDNQQVAFLYLTQNSKLLNPIEETVLNGGLYTLIVKQTHPTQAYTLEFEGLYRFNERYYRNNIINSSVSGITVIDFIAIENQLYGDVTYLSGNY